MSFSVVLDTCVLYPAHLRDTLLRLAERGLYRVLWPDDIVDERAFPDASIAGYKGLINAMTCDPKDRHVLAAAVRADASAVITFNKRDFPSSSVYEHEIDVIDPDNFLLDLLDLSPRSVIQKLKQQAEANQRRPKTLACCSMLSQSPAWRASRTKSGDTRCERLGESVTASANRGGS